jgi:hypothetical protein
MGQQIDLQLRHLIRHPGLLEQINLLVCWRIAGERSLGVGESVQAVQKA